MLAVLNCAFDVSEVRAIPTARTQLRTQHYLKGLKRFFELGPRLDPFRVTLSDNTVDSTTELNAEIAAALASYPIDKLDLKKDNELGARNKGAGVLVSLLRNLAAIKAAEFVFYFEPRLFLRHFDFIDKFLAEPQNIFSFCEGNACINTGLFFIEGPLLHQFCQAVDPASLVAHSISLEYALYDFIISRNIPHFKAPEMGVTWHDSQEENYLKM